MEVLTVLDAQDDVSEVEPGLVLAEGLLAGHLHHRPVGRREGKVSPLQNGSNTHCWGFRLILHHFGPSSEGWAPSRSRIKVQERSLCFRPSGSSEGSWDSERPWGFAPHCPVRCEPRGPH